MSVKIRKRKLSDGRIALRLDIYWKGERRSRGLELYLGTDPRVNREIWQMAEYERNQEELALSGRALGIQTSVDRKILLTDYLRELAKQKRTDSTIYHYKYAAKLVETFAGTAVRIIDVDGDWLGRFKAWLLQGRTHNSATTTYAIVSAALRHAVKQGKVKDNPTVKEPQLKFQQTKREFLSESEIERLAATECAHPDVRRAFLFSCFTGLRFSDVSTLVWRDVVLDTGRGSQIRVIQTKTRETIYLPLSETAVSLLGMPGGEHDRVFTLHNNDNTNKVLQRWAKEAGHTRHITFHAARHSFAMMLLRAGVSIFIVQQLLGHANINTTLTYLHMLAEDQQQAINRLPVLALRVTNGKVQETELTVPKEESIKMPYQQPTRRRKPSRSDIKFRTDVPPVNGALSQT